MPVYRTRIIQDHQMLSPRDDMRWGDITDGEDLVLVAMYVKID